MKHDTGLRSRDHPDLHDHVALDEIELYAEVLIAVADADRPLSPTEIDRVLGVSPQGCGTEPPSGVVPGPSEGLQDRDGEDGEAAPSTTGAVSEQAGAPSPVREREPGTRLPEPREECPGASTLPDTGPLLRNVRVLPEVPPFTGVLPVPCTGPSIMRAPTMRPFTDGPL